jgi:DNA-binding NarL/FixJ family response regulator
MLTDRKVEILRHLAVGRSVAEIGKDLGLSVATIYEHIQVMRRRLGAKSSPELVRIAILLGIISAGEH